MSSSKPWRLGKAHLSGSEDERAPRESAEPSSERDGWRAKDMDIVDAVELVSNMCKQQSLY
jgi:hypothetical protein